MAANQQKPVPDLYVAVSGVSRSRPMRAFGHDAPLLVQEVAEHRLERHPRLAAGQAGTLREPLERMIRKTEAALKRVIYQHRFVKVIGATSSWSIAALLCGL